MARRQITSPSLMPQPAKVGLASRHQGHVAKTHTPNRNVPSCARLCCRARCRNPRGRGPQVRAHHELLPLPTVPVARADLGTFHIQIAPVESSQIPHPSSFREASILSPSSEVKFSKAHGVSQVDPFIPGGLVKYDLQNSILCRSTAAINGRLSLQGASKGSNSVATCRVTRRCPQAAQAALAAGCVLGCAGGHRRLGMQRRQQSSGELARALAESGVPGHRGAGAGGGRDGSPGSSRPCKPGFAPKELFLLQEALEARAQGLPRREQGLLHSLLPGMFKA